MKTKTPRLLITPIRTASHARLLSVARDTMAAVRCSPVANYADIQAAFDIEREFASRLASYQPRRRAIQS